MYLFLSLHDVTFTQVFGVSSIPSDKTVCICIKGLYFCLKWPHWIVTGSFPPTVSPSTHLMGLRSPLARHRLTTSARSFSLLQINYESTKTQLTTQQIHPFPFLFTGDWDTCSTVNIKTSFVPLKVENLHTDVTADANCGFWYGNNFLEPKTARFNLKDPSDKLEVFIVCVDACTCMSVQFMLLFLLYHVLFVWTAITWTKCQCNDM